MFRRILSDKKILFLAFIILIIFLSILQQLFFGGSINKENDIVVPTPSMSLLPTFIVPTLENPDAPPFTGEKDVPVPTQFEYVNSAYDLRSKLPVSENGFSLEYNYQTYKFVVTIQPPFESNKLLFNEWLNVNGYGSIPQSEFVYQ